MTPSVPPVTWPDPQRARQFQAWLTPLVATHGLLPDTLVAASSDASSRRYLRLSTREGASRIIMDAPATPNQVEAFVAVGRMLAGCGLHVPTLYAHDETLGFALLEDLGSTSYLQALQAAQQSEDLGTAQALIKDATTALLRWQASGHGAALPRFDEAFVRRELQIFVDWCVQAHHCKQWTAKQQDYWDRTVTALAANIAAQPVVPMHRDYMARNLMVCPRGDDGNGAGPDGCLLNPGVLDFQDAVLGPITYDIGSLLRDAFLSWDEAEEIDWAVRYWEGARRAGLFGLDASGEDPHEMAQDFGVFWRALEWTVLQRHLKILGIFCRLKHRDGKPHYAQDLPRFYAYVIKTATRYVELSPLLRLMEDLQPQLLQTGFSLR
jgi:aminoglycoside/choline kinase family phosphotransferase